jgi:hypothetical protein
VVVRVAHGRSFLLVLRVSLVSIPSLQVLSHCFCFSLPRVRLGYVICVPESKKVKRAV